MFFQKIISGLGLGLIIAFTLFIIGLNSCMTFRTSDQKTVNYFEKKTITPNIHRSVFEEKEVRFIEVGMDVAEAPLLVFVHGAPGSLDAFNAYLSDSILRSKARMISIDRLGYGYSNYGKAEVNIGKQAEQIKHIVEQFPSTKTILLGHSYGGPIVGKYAIDYPDQVNSIVMLAPVNDPDNEKIFWFSHFARWKLTRWMLPKPLKVSGDEKFTHAEELRKIASEWQSLKVPVVHIHGRKDKLAPPINIEFSRQHIPKKYLDLIILEEGNHFVPWNQFDLVRSQLIKLLDN